MKSIVSFLALSAIFGQLAFSGVVCAPKYSDYNFDVQFAPSASLVALAGTSTFSSGNRTFAGFAPSSSIIAQDVAIIPKGAVNSNVQVSSLVGSVTTSGSIIYVSVSTPFLKKRVALSSSLITGTAAQIPVGWIAGSLGNQMDTLINSAIATAGTANISASTALFSSTSGSNVYVRNSSLWLSGTGIDFSGASPWNNNGWSSPSNPLQVKSGCLVSPRHFIQANHLAIANGSQIRFVASDGTVTTRTVVNQQHVGSGDINVAVLDSDVPSTICFYPVAPATLNNYSSDHRFWPIPLVTTDQQKHVYISDVCFIGAGVISLRTPVSSARMPFNHVAITGDSGSPCFFVVNGKLVLAGCYLFPDMIPDLSQNISAINAAMTALGGGYQLTIADLSAFTSY